MHCASLQCRSARSGGTLNSESASIKIASAVNGLVLSHSHLRPKPCNNHGNEKLGAHARTDTQWPNMKRVCRTENKNTKRDENQKEKEATNKTRMDARSHHKKEDKTTSENAVSKHLSCYNSSLIQTCPDTAMVS